MKTKLLPTARFHSGLSLPGLCFGLLAVIFAFPLRASDETGGEMKSDMAAMMKHMSAMMEKMGAKMTAAQPPEKRESIPAADMAMMSRMMKDMGSMMSAMSGQSDKADSSEPKGGMCSCEKMMSDKDKLKDGNSTNSPVAKPANAPSGTAAPAATDHSAHH